MRYIKALIEKGTDSPRIIYNRYYNEEELKEYLAGLSLSELGDKDLLIISCIWIIKLLRDMNMVGSSGQARRLIQQGGVYIDRKRITDIDHQVPHIGEICLQVGKHRFKQVVFTLEYKVYEIWNEDDCVK